MFDTLIEEYIDQLEEIVQKLLYRHKLDPTVEDEIIEMQKIINDLKEIIGDEPKQIETNSLNDYIF